MIVFTRITSMIKKNRSAKIGRIQRFRASIIGLVGSLIHLPNVDGQYRTFTRNFTALDRSKPILPSLKFFSMQLKTKPLFAQACVLIGMAFLLMFYSCGEEKKESLDIRLEAAATTLNPLMPSPGYSRYVSGQVFQMLGLPDPETLEMKPLLAQAIPTVRTVAEGAHQGELAYDFAINTVATWDNGSPVTGEDVVFTLKLIFHQGLPTDVWRGYYEYLTNIEVDPANPKKFTAYFRQYYILALESLCQTPIYPAYNYDPKTRLKNTPLADFLNAAKAKTFAESANGKAFAEEFSASKYTNEPQFISGSGPYRMESMNEDQGTVLIKKKNWWGDQAVAGNPLLGAYPERLVYKIVKDETAAVSLLQTEDLDIAMDLSPVLYKEIQQDTHLTRLYDFKTRWMPRYSRLLLNLRNPDSILADVRVRRALAYVIDYDYLINTVQQGFAQPIVGPINPAKPHYAKDLPRYTYNPAEAQKLLAQAGWKDTDRDGVLDKLLNGQRVKLSLKILTPNGSKVADMVADNIREKARQIGMDLVLNRQDINNISKATRSGDFQIASFGSVSQPGLDELNQAFHSSSLAPKGDNRSGYQNPRLDSVIVAIRTTQDAAARNKLYVEAQRILHEDVPEVFLFSSYQRATVAKKYNYVLTTVRPGYYEQLFQLK